MPFDADTKALEGTVAWCECCHKYVVNGYCWSCGQICTKNRIDLSVYDNEPEGGIDVLRACIGVWKFLYEVGRDGGLLIGMDDGILK